MLAGRGKAGSRAAYVPIRQQSAKSGRSGSRKHHHEAAAGGLRESGFRAIAATMMPLRRPITVAKLSDHFGHYVLNLMCKCGHTRTAQPKTMQGLMM
jgi:hypothetical protein